jgi:uncharacterized Zn finger protein (UPF0148 family)
MRIRGERECDACGSRWSYYETGSVTCPECGSIRSTGRGERAEHTDGPATLDLAAVRADVDDAPLDRIARRSADAAGEYLRRSGFVHAGDLQPLGARYLAAAELRRVGGALARSMRIDDSEELYFLSLLRGVERGERPPPAEVPDSLRAQRGLAVAATAEAYVSDVRRVVGEPEPPVGEVLSALRARRKRIEALDGDVDPAEAERLVRILRSLSAYLRQGDEGALARARERLSS